METYFKNIQRVFTNYLIDIKLNAFSGIVWIKPHSSMSGQFLLTLKFTFNIPIKSTSIVLTSLQNKQNTSH